MIIIHLNKGQIDGEVLELRWEMRAVKEVDLLRKLRAKSLRKCDEIRNKRIIIIVLILADVGIRFNFFQCFSTCVS